jgi:thiaminase/transcriptional activator TenA
MAQHDDIAGMGDNLFARLKAANADEWDAYIHHPFVAGLADGSLPEACFRNYLGQDYLFLIQFARAYGLAAYKSNSLEDIRQAAEGLRAIIDLEMDPACGVQRRLGVEPCRYGDLHVALAPCIIGYGEIGLELAGAGADNPYTAWIAMYASDDYQAAAEAERRHLDALFRSRAGEGRMDGLAKIFNQATRLEAAFWQMGLNSPI